ncbi:pentapeptide [Rheinheimera phage vB_RspM_Barba14S]|uniref:Pentapeptide n=1 Tax=Rheinheimera phage vB_RspM_Barba14S TaxID=2565651 RepID=A0A4V1EZP5_9CAUD|nr:pentapeptide [Rheinheimera phage vB_RspM_Barba14S]
MKQEELNLILENHKKWLNDDGGIRADLRGANLSGANLKGADLRGANLRGADLWTAYLRGANLRGANLRGANLSGANLRGADLSGADLSGADLSGADLSGADMSRADLSGADLSGADLSGANLRSTIGNQGQIITIQTDVWQIVYTSDVMQIGCQRHSINDWLVFSDDHISKMDSKALEFWKKWKPILVLILERNK